MSSRTPNRSERRRLRAAALLLALPAALVAGPPPAVGGPPAAPTGASAPPAGPPAGPSATGGLPVATVGLPVAAVLPDGGRTALVVDLGASVRTDAATVSVTRNGTPVPADLVPVFSGDLAVALVVDDSAADAAALPAWLSAAARFALEAPDHTRLVVLGSGAPTSVVADAKTGPAGLVRALQSVRPNGERDTSGALGLAVRQFPGGGAGRRVIVLYTTAPDAGGPTAAALAGRLRRTGTILVVVGTAAAGQFWAEAATATGGFFAPAGDPVGRPALDQVATTLGSRYLVRFATPPDLPARVAVTVQTGDLALAGEATVPGPARRPIPWVAWVAWGCVAGAVLLLVAFALVPRRRRAGRSGDGPAGPSPPVHPGTGTRVTARGRASVPGAMRAPGTRP